MSKHVFVVLAALLAFVLDGVLPSHAEPASRATGFGRVTYIEGSASVRLTPTARFRDLVEGNLIRPGQLIRTRLIHALS